ncbi:MAG: helix-turn-helix domain-containing protein [Chloroflexota bacterium]
MPGLKELRCQKGLTQAQLASLSGLGLSTVKKIEWGRTRPSNEIIFKLAKALDVIPEDIEVRGILGTTFLERAQRLREVTDTELVRKTGLSRTTLQRLRRGGKPQSKTVVKLAGALNVPPARIGGPAYGHMTSWKMERLRKGISVADLANWTDLSRQSIYNIEEGIYEPTESKARRLADMLGIAPVP